MSSNGNAAVTEVIPDIAPNATPWIAGLILFGSPPASTPHVVYHFRSES